MTGNAWAFPINRVAVRVVMPAGAASLGHVGYTGKFGEKGTDYKVVNVAGDSVDFSTSRQLLPGEGLTIAVKWPKGLISKPAGLSWQTFVSRIDGGLQTLLISAGVLPLYFFPGLLWVGRGLKAGLIIPRYDPPANMSPAAISYAHYMRLKNIGHGTSRALIAGLISLAVKQRISLGRGIGYMTIDLLDRNLDGLPPGERAIINGFFRRGDHLSLSASNAEQYVAARDWFRRAFLNEYEGAFFKKNLIYLVVGVCIAAVGIFAMLFKHPFNSVEFYSMAACAGAAVLVALGYSRFDGLSWKNHSLRATGMMLAGGLILLFVSWLAMSIDPVMLVSSLTVFVLIGTIVMAAYLLRAPTLSGRKLMDQIDGFKMYLSAAEAERLNMSHPPEMSIRHFEKFLPYAIALGIERQWSDNFASQSAQLLADRGSSTYRPRWIASGEWSVEGVGDAVEEMVSSMSEYTSGITPTLMDRVTGSGSGSGSGFSGGSSGGGGGGGGGGGW